jgi:hypothetical protein
MIIYYLGLWIGKSFRVWYYKRTNKWMWGIMYLHELPPTHKPRSQDSSLVTEEDIIKLIKSLDKK